MIAGKSPASPDAALLPFVYATGAIARLYTAEEIRTFKHLPKDVVTATQQAGARGIIVDRKAVLARPEVVDELHAEGTRVVVYTLNKDAQWDEVTALGVDGIVTDDPHTLSEWQSASAGER